MAKLFSFEEQDLDQAGTDVELDSSAEEGATAQTVVDMDTDLSDIVAGDEAVQVGTDAAGQLEAVEAGVGAAVESGDGLDQKSAEAYRIAVESIALMVGAPKKSVYALYSTENFGSVSSRMANTRISLEGIGDFLKNLWERIKSAIKSVIEKVKAFYAKHLSGIGRVQKALDSMKAKITANKGTLKAPRVKAPSALKSAFPTSTSLKASDIEDYLERHDKASKVIAIEKCNMVVDFVDNAKSLFAAGPNASAIEAAAKALYAKDPGDSEDKPFVGGVWFKTETSGDDIAALNITRQQTTTKSGDDAEVSVASKSEMTKLVATATKLITTTKTFDKAIKDFSTKFNAKSAEFEKAFGNAEKFVDEQTDDTKKEEGKDALAMMKKVMAFIGKAGSSAPRYAADMSSLNVKAAFAVVSYVKFNLAQYK